MLGTGTDIGASLRTPTVFVTLVPVIAAVTAQPPSVPCRQLTSTTFRLPLTGEAKPLPGASRSPRPQNQTQYDRPEPFVWSSGALRRQLSIPFTFRFGQCLVVTKIYG